MKHIGIFLLGVLILGTIIGSVYGAGLLVSTTFAIGMEKAIVVMLGGIFLVFIGAMTIYGAGRIAYEEWTLHKRNEEHAECRRTYTPIK